jgi:ketoreductase RED2
VLNITSLAGVRQVGSSIPYAVSKAGLNHMTRLLARALGPEIRVNAVAPGLVGTPWTAGWTEIHEFQNENAPLRRTGKPRDIAHLCVMLATSEYVTGEVIVADGGLGLL